MKVLFISYVFPPYNIIGSIRSGKTAKYLNELGVAVQILCGKDLLFPETLKIEIPRKNICSTRWWNVNALPERFLGGKEAVKEKGYSDYAAKRTGPIKSLGALYKNLFNFPDAHIGWYPFAVRAGSRLIRQNRPDLIFASAKPYTSLLIASRLSKKFGIPWVGELRDLWMENHFWKRPPWRQKIEQWLERRVLSSSNGLVTVSEPLAQVLRKKYDQPVAVINNGYDNPAEFFANPPTSAPNELLLSYTGGLYEGKQDLSPLFKALALLGEKANSIKVKIVGPSGSLIHRLAKEFGVEHRVSILPPVSHHESLTIQNQSDILILLLWNDINEKGIFTGKIFEYLGSRRTILAIGSEQIETDQLTNDSGAGELVAQRKAGVVLNDPKQIADQLLKWLKQKSVSGEIPRLPPDACKGFSRKEQTEKLINYFWRILKNSQPTSSSHHDR